MRVRRQLVNVTRAVLVSIDSTEFVAAAVRLGEEARLLDEVEALEELVLLHVSGAALRGENSRPALETARQRGALVAVDLADLEAELDARFAFDLTMLRPDILLVRPEQQAALGAPAEGLARLPVLLLGERGVQLFGRRVPAPPGAHTNRAAFAAALCSAYLEGAMPVEAAARAMVFAAGL